MSKFLPESIPIAEAARRLNISSKTLRRWEKKGLLLGSRTPGGHRRYQLSDLERIAQLRRQKDKNQKLGFFRTHKEYIPIQEASKRVDVSTKTLRRWEARGLISSERTSGGHRRYLLPKIEEVAARIKREQAQHHPSPKPPHEIRIPPQVPVKIRETAVSSILVSEVPVLYQSLHVDQKRIFITILIFFVSFSLSFATFKIIPNSLKSKVLGRFIPKEELANQEIGPSVLAEATGPTTFNVNVESNFNDNVNIKGKLAVNGGSITSTAPTFNLVNTNAKTLNVGGAATTLSLGGTTGNTTINNNLAISGTLSVGGDFTKIRGVTYSFPSSQGAASTYLKNDSTGTLSWATISTPSKLSDLSGTLGVSNGGTGISSYTTGDVLYASASTTLSKLAIGTSGQFLTVSSGLPAWTAGPASGSFGFWQRNGTVVAPATITDDLAIGGTTAAAATFYVTAASGNVRVASGASIAPTVNLGADLGTTSLRFNNLYVGTINSNSTVSTTGQALFTYSPTDTTYGQSSVMINPTTAPTDSNLLGIGIAGAQRAGIDAEGDITLAYAGAAGSSVPTGTSPFSVYNHGTTQLFNIDISGNHNFVAGAKLEPLTDSTTALNIANSSGTSFVTFDTTNSRVGIGTTTPGTTLSVNGIISGPSTQNLRLQATGATAGSGSNGSIYFLDSSGTTRGRFDTATLASYGTGADGACTISSGSTNLTTGSCAGRGTADAVATAITAANNGTSTVTVTSTTGFAADDEVLLIQMTGTGVGNYETKTISYVNSSTQVTFKGTVVNSILNSYQSGAQMVRIPQYTSVTISSGATMTVSAWNGTTGGVLFLRATGTFSNSGTVDLNGLGGGGGTAGTAGNGGPGGSCNDNCSVAGNPGAVGGTGGTGTGPGAGGGTANGGGGGAGGAGGGGTGGGGAGSGGGGSGGAYGAATSTATTGATGGAGAGPTAAGGGGSAGAATAAVGDANFNRLMMGSGGQGGGGGGGGGGAGAQGENGFNGTGGSGGVGVAGGAGGAGGGLAVIAAATLTNSATIRANGAAGSNGSSNAGSGTSGSTSGGLSSGGGGGGGGTGGGGGGGSGGAVRLISNSLTAGTVTVTGGSGGSGGTTGGNGGGCAGNAAPKGGGGGGALGGIGGSTGCATFGSTASSSPTGTGATGSVGRTLNSTFAYGTLYAAALNTTAADLAEYYVTGDKSIESGDVVSISDSKVLGDNSQEITNKGVLRKATIPYDSKLIGIISTSPGVILGSIDGKTGQSDSRALALAGRVPVKIAPDSQPILIGDFLTSSDTHPGMAMKAVKAGYTVAKALESWNPSTSSGQIEAFVSLGYYLGPMTADGYINTASNFIANNIKVSLSSNDQLRLLGQSPTVLSSATASAQVASDSASPDTNVSVSDAISKLLTRLEAIEGDISLLKNASTSASPSPLATNYQLLTTNQLTVLGNSLLGDTVINGKLNVGVLSVDNKDGSLQAIGPLKIQPLAIDSIQFAGDTIEMDKNGNLNINKGVISGNGSIRDAANISPGQTSISVVKSWDKSPVSIQTTPSYKTTVWVTNITSSGFTINVSDSPTEPQKLFWWAVW